MAPAEIDRLYRLLLDEVDMLGSMAEAAEEKRDALVAVKSGAVEAASKREEMLVSDLAALEERRAGLFHVLGERLGIEGEITIESISRATGEPNATRLADAKRRIAEKAGQVKKLSELNGLLAVQGLTHVHGILGLISRGGAVEPTYASPGSRPVPAETASIIVDKRV
jgi:hypothetical protein